MVKLADSERGDCLSYPLAKKAKSLQNNEKIVIRMV
jgi:hypothetical protein